MECHDWSCLGHMTTAGARRWGQVGWQGVWGKGGFLRDSGAPCSRGRAEGAGELKTTITETRKHTDQETSVSLDAGEAWLGRALAALNYSGLLCLHLTENSIRPGLSNNENLLTYITEKSRGRCGFK